MIYYDRRDLEEIDKRELRKKLGVVLQDGGLISGSIHDNIVITAPETDLERVEETIKEVGLEEDIAGMPKVIFLDEATTALDNVTQNMAMEIFEETGFVNLLNIEDF